MDKPVEGYPVPGTLDEVLGFELLEASAERLQRPLRLSEKRVQQPFGLVHGGAYVALAETLASVATFAAVAGDGNIAVGQSNHTTSCARPPRARARGGASRSTAAAPPGSGTSASPTTTAASAPSPA